MNKKEIVIPKEKLKLARDMIHAAKIALLKERPFYGTIVCTMPVYEDTKWLPTIATNGRDLFYNPEFIAGWTPERRKESLDKIEDMFLLSRKEKDELIENMGIFYKKKTIPELIFLLEHEIRHVICDVMARGRDYVFRVFNIAADHYTNVSLWKEHSITTPGLKAWFTGFNHVFDKNKEFGFLLQGYMDKKYDKWVTEKIYEDIMKNHPPIKNITFDFHMGEDNSNGSKQSGDNSGPTLKDLADALGVDLNKEPKIDDTQKAKNQELITRAIKSAVDVCKAAGQAAPEEVREWVGQIGKAKVNYLQLIRATLKSFITSNPSYRRPSKRGMAMTHSLRQSKYITNNQTIVMPKRIQDETIDVWIGFDVSGSINDQLLNKIYKEIMGLTLQYKVFKMHLFCWSTHVGEIKEYTKQNIRTIVDYKIKTSFGTRASCVFEELDEQKAKVDQLIIFTDGEFSDVPDNSPWKNKYKTLWVIFGRAGKNWKAPFGKAVDFDNYVR